MPGCAMQSLGRIKAPVPTPQWDFGTSGSEAQPESGVDRSREGKKKNKDRREELGVNLGERKTKETERASRERWIIPRAAKGKAQEGCPILRLRNTAMAVTCHS